MFVATHLAQAERNRSEYRKILGDARAKVAKLLTNKRIPFPTKAQILRLVEAAKAAGIIIGAIRVSPTGDVTVLDKSFAPTNDDPNLSEYV